MPVLVFVGGQKAGTELPVGGQIVLGRDPGAADVILDQDTEISRRHATFSPPGPVSPWRTSAPPTGPS